MGPEPTETEDRYFHCDQCETAFPIMHYDVSDGEVCDLCGGHLSVHVMTGVGGSDG